MSNPFEDLRQAVVVRPMNSPGPQGAAGPEIKIQYSNEGSSWHDIPLETDRYLRFSTDNGVSWSDAIYFNNLSETLEWVEKARQWAENPEGVEVEPGQYSALHHKEKALEAQIAAESAESAAAMHEYHSSVYALNASQSADEAAYIVGVSQWSSSETYIYPEVVSYIDGHTYRCIATSPTSEIPGESVHWVRLSYDPSNIIDDDGSHTVIMKNSVVLDGTIWFRSRYGIMWNESGGYMTVFKTYVKVPIFDMLYLRKEDPDMLGELTIGNSTTLKYDAYRDHLNIYVSGRIEETTYISEPIYTDGDTCGPISLIPNVTLAVDSGNLILNVFGVLEDTPPDVFDINASHIDITHIGKNVTKTPMEFIEQDGVALSFHDTGIYSNEFIEDDSVSYFVVEKNAIRIPSMVEVI